MSAIEQRMVDYAASLSFAELSPEVVHHAKRRIIDTIGAALAAYTAPPVQIARKLALPVAGTFGARVWGSLVRTTPDLAAFANGTMLRLTVVPELAPQPFTIAGWQVPDVTAAVRQLSESGVRFIRYDGMEQDELAIWTTPGGDRVAWFEDPDGNTLSLTTFASSPGRASP